MAEFLIRARDTVLSDTDRATRFSWRRGDIVLKMPDGHAWGRNELFSEDNDRALFVLKVADFPEQEGNRHLEPLLDDLTLAQTARRRFRLVLDELTPAQRSALTAAGFLSLSWATARALIEDKHSRERESVRPLNGR